MVILAVRGTAGIHRSPASTSFWAAAEPAIYPLHPGLQDRALRVVHYGLVPGGYLVLGALETAAELHDRFSTVDAKLSIYAKRQAGDVAKRPVPSTSRPPRETTTGGHRGSTKGSRCSPPKNGVSCSSSVSSETPAARTTFEDLESANEELQSIELRSSNDELEGTNQELEREKEELQAATEELVGVNDELQARIVELRLATDDIHNLFDVTGNAVVIVGMDGRIRRLNDTARRLLKLESGDFAVPLSRIAHPLRPRATPAHRGSGRRPRWSPSTAR